MATVLLVPVEEDIERDAEEFNQDDFAYRNNVHNANIKIRMGFLRKVYILLCIQILVTTGLVSMFVISPNAKSYVDKVWTRDVLMCFLKVADLACGRRIASIFRRRNHLINLIFLVIFTLVQAYTVGVVVSMYDTTVVLKTLFITLTVLLSLIAYTFQTKRDFSFLEFGLFIGLWCLILGGFMQIFIQSTVIELIISIGGAVLFCLLIIYETKLIMYTFSPKEYTWATIIINLGIINLLGYIVNYSQSIILFIKKNINHMIDFD